MPSLVIVRGSCAVMSWPRKVTLAGLRPQITGRYVEERRLAGPVRPDDGEVFTFEDVEVNSIGGDDAAEPNLDVLCGKQDVGHQCPPCLD